LGINPKNVRALRALGCVYLAQNKYSQAEECYNKSMVTDDPSEKANAHVGLGHVYHSMGKRKAAIECMERAKEFHPDVKYVENMIKEIAEDKSIRDNE
jgi:tetratricopeptide (TPR) repeat protein